MTATTTSTALVTIQPTFTESERLALAGGQVDGAGGAGGERDGDDLAALAGDDQGAVAAVNWRRSRV